MIMYNVNTTVGGLCSHIDVLLYSICTCLFQEFCDGWLAQDTDKARFMKQIFKHSMESSHSERIEKELVDGQGFISCDSYAMAAAIDDTYVIETEHRAVTVELAGNFCRGMMVVDHIDVLKKTHKAHILKKVDLERFKVLMMNALK